MLISYTRLINLPILSLQTGGTLGRVTEPIIDPRQFHIVAFYCAGPRIRGTAVLHTTDIREVSSVGIIVDDADSLMSPDEDLVRLKEVLDLHFSLLGKSVIDTHKRKLGKVEGYSFEMESFFIMKVNVRQPLIRSLTGSNLLIDRTQIIKITDSQLVVQGNDTRGKQKSEQRVSAPLIDNPFRRPHAPQPDGSAAKITPE